MFSISPPMKKAWLLVFCCCAVGFNTVFSQAPDFFLKSADDELAIEVSRGEQSVTIALYFIKASQYESVLIERSDNQQLNFSQCKYIKFNDSANDTVVLSKKDTYPMPFANDIYYRVKTITKDGVTRIYPSVRLPGVQNVKQE